MHLVRASTRAPLHRPAGLPAHRARRLRAWVGVGGSPESVVRAARHGLPLMLAIIGGDPLRFAPFVDLYHRALDRVRAARRCRSASTRPATSPPTDEQARDELWPHYAADARPHRRRARLAAR